MNTEPIRKQMKFQVVIENKNASGLHRWINDMVAGQVFTMTFLEVLQNLGHKMLFLLPLYRLKQQLLYRQYKRRKRRHKKILKLL